MAALSHRSTLTAPANFVGNVLRSKYNVAQAILALKSIACSNGYTVGCSGDGDAQVLASGDVFNLDTLDGLYALLGTYGDPQQNNTPARPRSFYNARPHFTLKRPGGLSGELAIQIISNVSPELRIKYSSGGFDGTTATANRQPAPLPGSTEIILLGSGSNVSPIGWAVPTLYSTSSRLIIGVNGDTTAPYLYMKLWTAGAAPPAGGLSLMWDSMLGNRVAVTPNNGVVFAGSSFTLAELADEDKIITPAEGYTFAGQPGSSGAHRMVPTVPTYNQAGYGLYPLVGALGHDLLGGRIRGIAGEYVRRNVLAAPDGGIYGRSNAWRWNTENWDLGRMGVDRDGVSWVALDNILVRVNLDDVTGTGGVKISR